MFRWAWFIECEGYEVLVRSTMGFGARGVRSAYQFFVRGPYGVIVSAQVRGGDELDTADRHVEFFCEFDPVCACFFVGVCVIWSS